LITIALDAMGGDHGLTVTVPAAVASLAKFPDVRLVLVGQPAAIDAELSRHGAAAHERLTIQPASEVVGMDEPPAQAMRTKKDSSMRVAIDLVKRGEADACVSAGNTGALMGTARFVLKTLPGIDRPAIIAALPSERGHVHVLDLGANVDCDAEHLVQFAVMASIMVSAIEGKPAPRVGLLNVGEEDIKGNEVVKAAAERLKQSQLNYVGFVEGNEIYTGDVDVIVCDGFVGNVALKTSEGLAHMMTRFMREAFKRNLLTTLAGVVAFPVLRAFRRRVDPRHYNGATLLGLNGTVIKSHGGADRIAFANAIGVAIAEARNRVPQRITEGVTAMLNGVAA